MLCRLLVELVAIDVAGVYSHQVWEDNAVLEGACDPYQIQRILINTDLACKTGCVVAAQEGSSIWVDTYPEVPNPDLQLCLADDVRYSGSDARVDLCRIKIWRI